MKPFVKKVVKGVARGTIGRLPRSSSRFTGKLASEGGKPVRDIRFRPWADHHSKNRLSWSARLAPRFRRIFLNGAEGLPQPLAKRFADRWAEYCGCRYGLLVGHGTDALRIGLAAALDHDGLDYGGEIIVPNFSFIATATAALDRRFGLVFVDVTPDTLLIDSQRVEEAIIPGKTRAIMPVHLFGQPANMTALRSIADRHGLRIIEDAAQAHGAMWETGPVGSLGDVAGFSFQSFKNLNCGEGGALTTNDEEVFDRAYSMHNAGRARIGGGRWEHIRLGWNCRPTEYQAAVLLERFRTFERQQEIRRRNFARLRKMLEEITCVVPLATGPGVRKHGLHMFVMRYRRENCGDLPLSDFLKSLQAEGTPIHQAYAATMAQQPVIQDLLAKHEDYFRMMPTPVADEATQDTTYIPQNVFLGTETDMADIAMAIRKVQRHFAPAIASSAARNFGGFLSQSPSALKRGIE